MPIYRITDTLVFEIEAPDEDAAVEAHLNNDTLGFICCEDREVDLA